MIRVAVAGGAGNLGREIVEVLQAEGKHSVLILSRTAQSTLSEAGFEVAHVDYTDREQLAKTLNGVHTVLNFIASADLEPHKNLIDASIEAGVKRFAPSEWATVNNCGWGQYQYKDDIKEYLESKNKEKVVLEYCLFQPGYLLDYVPFPLANENNKHVMPTSVGYDMASGDVILTDGGNDFRCWTTVHDIATIVAKALDYQGVWPRKGGMRGERIQTKDLVALLHKYSSVPIKEHHMNSEDLERGDYKADWVPTVQHPSFGFALPAEMIKGFICQFEIANVKHGALDVSDEWNQIFPEYKFTGLEDLLKKITKA